MPPVSPHEYAFEHVRTLSASPGVGVPEVYDVLQDVEGYPAWWRSVTAVGRLEEDVALVACRSVLPVTLHVVLRPRVEDREAGVLEASVEGDLAGWSRFDLDPTPGGVHVLHTQEVRVARPLLSAGSLLARRLLVWNHDRMIEALWTDLEARLLSGDGR